MTEVCTPPIKIDGVDGEVLSAFGDHHTLSDIARWIMKNPTDAETVRDLLDDMIAQYERDTELRVAMEQLKAYTNWIPVGSVWRHSKSGHLYVVDAHALYENPISPMIIYRRYMVSTTDRELLWARSSQNFSDGRFVRHFDGD